MCVQRGRRVPRPHLNASPRPRLPASQVEYAVRGEIVRRAQQIAEDLEKGAGDYPFDKVTRSRAIWRDAA